MARPSALARLAQLLAMEGAATAAPLITAEAIEQRLRAAVQPLHAIQVEDVSDGHTSSVRNPLAACMAS